MAAISTISSKGQVTVPVEVRRRLGVKEGDKIEFFFDGTCTVLRPVRPDENRFAKWVGALAKNTPEGTAVAWVREMRDAEETEP
jgi:AbrB family looped-hinge helix DNA binding protein